MKKFPIIIIIIIIYLIPVGRGGGGYNLVGNLRAGDTLCPHCRATGPVAHTLHPVRAVSQPVCLCESDGQGRGYGKCWTADGVGCGHGSASGLCNIDVDMVTGRDGSDYETAGFV